MHEIHKDYDLISFTFRQLFYLTLTSYEARKVNS